MNEPTPVTDPTTVEPTNRNQALIDCLRAMALFIEERDLPRIWPRVSLDIPCCGRADLLSKTCEAGRLEKVATKNSSYFSLRKVFLDECYIDFYVSREKVCEKIVTAKVIPARPEMIVPATPERVEEVVSWSCPESLLMKSFAQQSAETLANVAE